MKLNVAYIIIKTDKKIKEGTNNLRGYIGNRFKEYSILHNHYGGEKFLYSYPLVQYQILDGHASILAIEDGINILKNISGDLNELKLRNSYYKVEEVVLHEKVYDICPSKEEHHYKFLSPWLALNSDNFQRFNKLKGWKDKKIFLNKILVGNILSMSKGLGIIVNKRLHAKSHLEPVKVNYKSVVMQGFTGEFKVHYQIPDFFGFGKGVSQGFGTVKEIKQV